MYDRSRTFMLRLCRVQQDFCIPQTRAIRSGFYLPCSMTIGQQRPWTAQPRASTTLQWLEYIPKATTCPANPLRPIMHDRTHRFV